MLRATENAESEEAENENEGQMRSSIKDSQKKLLVGLQQKLLA